MILERIEPPAIVLADNLKSWTSQQIKLHSHGYYSHAMWLRASGKLVSQDWKLTEKDLSEYLVPHYRLKFFHKPELQLNGKAEEIEACLDKMLSQTHRYDWLGVAGHLLGCRGLQFGGRWYCTEAVWEPFVEVLHFAPIHPTPQELNWMLPELGWSVAVIVDPRLGTVKES